jgi:sarcosine oxidase subunit beta
MNYLSQPPRSADLVVIGGGVVGAATAWSAARAGVAAVLVEARPALCTLTTPVAAGAFRLQFDNREELNLVRESSRLFLNFPEETGQSTFDLGLRQQGYLWLTTDEAMAKRQRRLVGRLRGWGQTDVEILSGEEARRRFPYIGPDVLQARFRAGDGFLDTKRLTFGLALGSGAGVVLDCRATGFRTSGGRLTGVETSRGVIGCGAAVIAAGPLSGEVARTAGITMPVVTIVRNKLWVPDLATVPQDAPMTIDEDLGPHWRPAFGGAWLLYTDPATPPTEPTEAVTPDPGFAFRLLNPRSPLSVARTAPFWRTVWESGAVHWLVQAGQYTVTPDHRPLIGSTALEGLWVNTGYSGHGIMLSPAGSRLLMDLFTGVVRSEDNPFRPDRRFEPREQPTL